MTTNANEKAPGATNSKGLHTDTNAPDSASHGPINQSPTPFMVVTAHGAVLPKAPPDSAGWRGALAAGVGHFRKYGAFSELVVGRRARRAMERQDAKAAKKGGKA